MSPDVRVHLQRELKKRRRANPRYSLRAFAEFLRVSPAFLSEVMNGKHLLSEPMLLKIGGRLKLNEEELLEFRMALKELRRENRLKRRPKREN